MLLCGIALTLRGMRGYEQLFIGVEKVTPMNQTKNQRRGQQGKSKREAACYFINFSGGRLLSGLLASKTANNPVATRTVFTTQIWDLYWSSSSIAHDGRLKSAQSMRQC